MTNFDLKPKIFDLKTKLLENFQHFDVKTKFFGRFWQIFDLKTKKIDPNTPETKILTNFDAWESNFDKFLTQKPICWPILTFKQPNFDLTR